MKLGYKCENFSHVYNTLDYLLDHWEGVTVKKLKGFVYLNLRFIIEQSQNETNAQDLQGKLDKLSNKINEKFITPSAHHLAFEIMGIAKGIFLKEEDKIDFTSVLPPEVRQIIYSELISTREDLVEEDMSSGLESVLLISKFESDLADKAKIEWINNESVSLKLLGFQTIKEAILFIKNNKNLACANLSEFRDLSGEDLKELQNCTWIKHLFISSDKVKDLTFLKGMLLKTIDFSYCPWLRDEALESLKEMPLQSVNFSACSLLTDKALVYLKDIIYLENINISDCLKLTDKAIEYLQGMQFKNIDFSNCPFLTDKALKYLNRMPLQNVNFRGCDLLTDNTFEHLKDLQLQEIDFTWCKQITDSAFEYLKKMPLTSIQFGYCPLITDKALESLKGMRLDTIAFSECYQLTDKAFECIKEMPLQNVYFNCCPELTDPALEYLKGMPLKRVDFRGCKKLTKEAIKKLVNHFNSLGTELICLNDF